MWILVFLSFDPHFWGDSYSVMQREGCCTHCCKGPLLTCLVLNSLKELKAYKNHLESNRNTNPLIKCKDHSSWVVDHQNSGSNLSLCQHQINYDCINPNDGEIQRVKIMSTQDSFTHFRKIRNQQSKLNFQAKKLAITWWSFKIISSLLSCSSVFSCLLSYVSCLEELLILLFETLFSVHLTRMIFNFIYFIHFF